MSVCEAKHDALADSPLARIWPEYDMKKLTEQNNKALLMSLHLDVGLFCLCFNALCLRKGHKFNSNPPPPLQLQDQSRASTVTHRAQRPSHAPGNLQDLTTALTS